MILTVAQTYPTKKNLYNNGFVHSRVKSYINEGIPAKVFVLSKKHTDEYEIENVNVKRGSVNDLIKYIENNQEISCVCFHFLNTSMLEVINGIHRKLGVVIFVHGNEALWWYERIFPDRFSGFIRTLKFFKYVAVNTWSMLRIRSKINKIDQDVHIVGVSNWMLDVAIKNWKLDRTKLTTHVIPNIVNEKVFMRREKSIDHRYNILLIRQFTSGKYALDIAMDTIAKLESSPVADKLKVTIIGDGWLFDKYTSRVSGYDNVHITRGFLTHEAIAEKHSENGIFLCPTRQDAQGVSMCEAMSSGLVPIASNNTAIPEFLPSEYNLAFDNATDAANRIIELVNDPDEYLDLTEKVSSFIQEKCCAKETTLKEIELMKSMDRVSDRM